MFQQASVVDDIEGEVRQGIEADLRAGGLVFDDAIFIVDFELVAGADFVERVRRFDEVEAVIDGVAIEDSCE